MLTKQMDAHQVLAQFHEHPDSWVRVPNILETSAYPQSKVGLSRLLTVVFDVVSLSIQYLGLQILEKLIVTRWKLLSARQRQGTSLF